MKVFRLYWKLFFRNIKIVLVYVVIFLFITILMSASGSDGSPDFSSTKIKVAFENHDVDSELTQALVTYLKDYTITIEVKESDYADALYFRVISSVIVIPEDFGSDFINGEEALIHQEKLENKFANITIEREINKYLNYIRVYLNQTDMDLSESINMTNSILKHEVSTETQIIQNNEAEMAHSFFNFVSYIIFSITLTVVGLMTLKLRNDKIRRRMIVSPYPIKKLNMEMILGNMIFVFIFSVLIFLTSMYLYPNVMKFDNLGIYFIINLFAFSIATLALAYLLSLLIKNEAVLVGVNNVLALGMAFASGAFVPQEILGKGLLFISRITPSYYYINNNIKIIQTNTPSLNLVINNCLIQLIFAFCFISLAIFVSIKQLKKEE